MAEVKLQNDEAKEKSVVNKDPTVIKKRKVINGQAKIRKKPLSKQIAELFGVDSIKSVGKYLIGDIIIPAAKNTLSDFVSEGIDMILGIDYRHRPRSRGGAYGRMDYTSRYDRDRNRYGRDRFGHDRDERDYGRAPSSYEDIVFDSRADANRAIEYLCDLIDTYEQASIGDLFDAAGVSGGDYTDRRWGWKSIGSARIVSTRDGYVIDMPKPVPLNKT